MKTIDERLADMERDVKRVERLRSRWTHLFAAACVLSAVSGYMLVSGRPPIVAILLTVGSLALITYARRFPKQAMKILRKYEDMTMP